MINSHIKQFGRLPVVRYTKKKLARGDPGQVAWRLSVGSGDTKDFDKRLRRFLESVDPATVTALVVGRWTDMYDSVPPIDALVAAAPRLVNLRALFLGDITAEECEISWIQQDDVTPLLTAFPRLEILRVRGGSQLELQPVRHEALRELAFETGGLPAEVVRAVGESELPALRHLELWLGSDEYDGDTEIEDLAGILAGTRLPSLSYLGLRNAEIADPVAAALASAPVVARLTELDLSLGMVSDTGVEALLTGQPLTHLRELNLRHHFVSKRMVKRLKAELPTVKVNTKDWQDDVDADERYVAVSE